MNTAETEVKKQNKQFSDLYEFLLVDSVPKSSAGYRTCPEPYDQIHHELEKLTLPIPEKVDWKKVADISTEILTACERDYNVAHYLVVAMAEVHGFEALYCGLHFIDQYITCNWSKMRPAVDKISAREKSIAWFFNSVYRFIIKNNFQDADRKINEYLASVEVYSRKFSTLSACQYSIPKELRDVLTSSDIDFSDNDTASVDESSSCNLNESNHKAIINKKDNAELRSCPNPATAEKKKNSISDVAIDMSEIAVKNRKQNTNSTVSESELLLQCRNNLLELGVNKLRRNQTDPAAYYYRRVASWLSMQQAPVYDKEGTTQLKAPSDIDKSALIIAHQQSDISNIIVEAESMLERFPLWLDANIFTINALRNMKCEYKEAENTIVSLLMELLNRLPELRRTKFCNGENMFGKKCSDFEEIQDQAESDSNRISGNISDIQNSGEIIFKTQKPSAFVATLNASQVEIDKQCDYRIKCQLHIKQIKMCIENHKYDLALAQISYLWGRVSEIDFLSWETDMSVLLSKYHIRTILAKHAKRPELRDEDKLRCRELYQYLSGVTASAAAEIEVARFM